MSFGYRAIRALTCVSSNGFRACAVEHDPTTACSCFLWPVFSPYADHRYFSIPFLPSNILHYHSYYGHIQTYSRTFWRTDMYTNTFSRATGNERQRALVHRNGPRYAHVVPAPSQRQPSASYAGFRAPPVPTQQPFRQAISGARLSGV